MKKVCNKCGQCCKGTMGPFVFPSDVDVICKFLDITTEKFLNELCERYIVMVKSKEVEIYALKKEKEGCIFLNKDNLCEIYDVRPYQCKKAPYEFLAGYGLWNHMRCIDFELEKLADTTATDTMIFSELISNGYKYL